MSKEPAWGVQGYVGQCMAGNLALTLLGQCLHGRPSSPTNPWHNHNPSLACYLLAHLHRPLPSPLYWFHMQPTLPPYSFTAGYFLTGDSVCSHPLKLVPCWQIFILWTWRWYVHLKHRFTQDLHGATSQKTAFFKIRMDNTKGYGYSHV
jgi:hypothetical protein